MCWASLDTNPHLSGYGLYTSLHNYTSKVQPLPLVEKRTMPELYPVGPLLYHHLKILPQLKDCCSGTRTKLTRKDRFMQPANECIIKVTTGLSSGWTKGDYLEKDVFTIPNLGASSTDRCQPTFHAGTKFCGFKVQGSVLWMGRRKKKNQWKRVLSQAEPFAFQF